MAYTFADWNQCTAIDSKSKHQFAKTYLKELGLPCNDEQVELLVFDAECAKLRAFHCSKLNHEMEMKCRNKEYDLGLYKAYEQFESIARADKQLIKKVAQEGIYRAADASEILKEYHNKTKKAENKDAKTKGVKQPKKLPADQQKMYKIKTNAANSVINFANGLRSQKVQTDNKKKVWK